ncbi:MAG TPA: sialidase family protein [Victivallales bacterium]|nr:sialidase family protein [Victivallales bacterium]
MKQICLSVALVFGLISMACADQSQVFSKEPIFPPQEKHTHSSSIIALPNGDLLACWFYGSGERHANDVIVQGARLVNGSKTWSKPFEMADTPNVPDCNPVLFENNGTIWLYWIAVENNEWHDAILHYEKANVNDINPNGSPKWNTQGIITMVPGDIFYDTTVAGFDWLKENKGYDPIWADYAPPYYKLVEEAAKDPVKRQKGWQTRIHPIVLQHSKKGRILLPLYSDGFNMSLVAISDDNGKSWMASKPIVGLGPIQPSIVEKNDGTLVAYCRDSGSGHHVQISTSTDSGETWSAAVYSDIPNPGSSLEVIKLNNGDWLMVSNDLKDGRYRLTAALSENQGSTWDYKRTIAYAPEETGNSYSYPSVLQTSDGMIHLTYSCVENGKETIEYAYFNTDWLMNK